MREKVRVNMDERKRKERNIVEINERERNN